MHVLRLLSRHLLIAALLGGATTAVLAQGAPTSLIPAPRAATPAGPTSATTPNAPAQAKPTVERVNTYLNSLAGLTADFTQTGPDGRRYDGKLYLSRPGKLRFEYKPPSPLEIVSDGRSVAVRDRKLNTQDLYLIGQTPLKFLLQDKIDIGRDSKVVSLVQQGNDAVLVIDDKATIGGTSRIKLVFNNIDMALKQWTITDPQGYDTRVQLSNLDLGKRPDARLFQIQEGRVETPR